MTKSVTLEGKTQNTQCPLMMVFGGGNRRVPPSEGRRLADAVGGSAYFMKYESQELCVF